MDLGTMAGLGAALSGIAPHQKERQELEAAKVKLSLEQLLAQSEIERRKALTQQGINEEQRRGEEFALQKPILQHQAERLPMDDALKALGIMTQRDPVGVWNSPEAVGLAKTGGVPFPSPEENLGQGRGPLSNEAYNEDLSRQGIAPQTGIKLPPAIQQMLQMQNYKGEALQGFNPKSPTDLQYNLLTGDNPPSASSALGGYNEFVEGGKPITLPNVVGMQRQLPRFHPPPAPMFNYLQTENGIVAGNRRSPGLTPVTEGNNGGQAQPPPSGTQMTSAINSENSLEQLQNLQRLYKKEFVGPAVGPYNNLRMKLPEAVRPGEIDPQMANFYAASETLKNTVIKAITGAQMSEPESKRIIGQIPTVNDPPEMWEAKYKQTQYNLADLAQRNRSKKAQPVGGAPVVPEFLQPKLKPKITSVKPSGQ